jgi:hypothetical protein
MDAIEIDGPEYRKQLTINKDLIAKAFAQD